MLKNAKNDEFYTQYHDIEKEITAYLEYNPHVFRGKTILLPCDDPEWSNFTRFFAQNFERLGLKKLISTSYAVDSKTYQSDYQLTLFETNDPQFDEIKATKNGKIFSLTHDKTGDHKVNVDDLEWHYLAGDGDFRSAEIKKLRDEADIIITNPPTQTAAAEARSESNCPLCAIGQAANQRKIWKLSEMDADHVAAWSKGGATHINNCQMLCKTHNRAKGNR